MEEEEVLLDIWRTAAEVTKSEKKQKLFFKRREACRLSVYDSNLWKSIIFNM